MSGRSIEDMQDALAATERILESLRREPDPDDAVRRIIQAVEDQEAELLALLLDPPRPSVLSNQSIGSLGDSPEAELAEPTHQRRTCPLGQPPEKRDRFAIARTETRERCESELRFCQRHHLRLKL